MADSAVALLQAESGMEKGISQGQNGHMENGNGYGNGNAVLVPGQQVRTWIYQSR